MPNPSFDNIDQKLPLSDFSYHIQCLRRTFLERSNKFDEVRQEYEEQASLCFIELEGINVVPRGVEPLGGHLYNRR